MLEPAPGGGLRAGLAIVVDDPSVAEIETFFLLLDVEFDAGHSALLAKDIATRSVHIFTDGDLRVAPS